MRVPPGVSAEDFSTAISEWKAAVGKDWVFTSDEDMNLYRDAYSPFWGEKEERVASAAVAPDSVEQVQHVVRTANRLKIPLYTISTGKNLTYGGSAPVHPGSVVLDLKRMNRILEVSEANASALVEPGVSYFDLYRHIREKKLKLWIDCPDPGWGSPIGNALDHGCGYTAAPYRDHFDAHCGMEVVLASGELVRTGMGAMPGAQTWQQFKYGMGPIVDGLFAQSNFGVVTKMGFWLMPEPEAALSVTVSAPRYENGARFADTLIALVYEDLIRSQTQIFSPVLHDAQEAEHLAMLNRWDADRIERLNTFAERKGLPFWTSQFSLYGREKVIRAQWDCIKERFAGIPGAQFHEDAFYRFPLTDEQVQQVTQKARFGIPSLAMFASRRIPNGPVLEGHLDFSPVLPMRGDALMEAMEVIGRALSEGGVNALGGMPLFYHTRTVTLIYAIPLSRDPVMNKAARETFLRLIKLCGARGWGEYRIHAAYMDEAISFYNYNSGALRRFHETLKDAVDPNGILSAGRYGIWPRHLRSTRA